MERPDGKDRHAMEIEYCPTGVCAQHFRIRVEDGRIEGLEVQGGCDGNLQGLSRLLRGMPVNEAVAQLEGIRCDGKATSCPDQLAQALKACREGD